jgi:outer membrane protein assembly factor BamB
MSKLFLAALVIFLLTGEPMASVGLEDWPQWRGPNRTGHVSKGARVPKTLPTEPRLVWGIEVGEGFASPVLAAGRVYYFDNHDGKETLHAINAANAREIWRVKIDDTFKDEQGPPGPRCTPLVDADRVYAQSGKGELQCLGVENGHRLWRVNFTNEFGSAFEGEDTPIPGAAEHGYTAAPVIDSDRLIACVGGTNGAGVVCFEKHTGKVLWKSQNDRAAYAAPVIANVAGTRQVVCFTVEGLLALALEDGALLWRFPIKTPYGRNCTTPVTLDDLVIVGSYRAGLLGIKVTSAGTGFKAERAWVNKNLGMNFSSPVMVGRHLFGLGPGRNVVCVEADSGRVTWSQGGYFNSASEVTFASFAVLGPNLLMSTDGGELVLMAADPGACVELSRAHACRDNWCSPAYADGRLYIRDGIKSRGSLYCIELLQ